MKVIYFILMLLIAPGFIPKTPDDGIIEHEVLIGYNDFYYYSIKVVNYPTGSYYEGIDSAFVFERELKTGNVKSKIFLKSYHHQDTTTYSDWKVTECNNVGFKYHKYLKNKKIKYIFPSIYRFTTANRNGKLVIDNKGLKLIYKDEKVLISNIDDIENYVQWINKSLMTQKEFNIHYKNVKDKFVSVSDFIEDGKYLFVILESKIDPEYLQSIIVINRDKIIKARQIIIDELNDE